MQSPHALPRFFASSLVALFVLGLVLTLGACAGDDDRTPGPLAPVGIPDAEHGPSTPDDIDGDGVSNDSDNCPSVANADQRQACTFPSRPAQIGDVHVDGLARLNWYRASVGLDPVEHDPALSAGCALHNSYLVQLSQELGAPQLGHREDLSRPYASEEGNEAGIDSVLSLGQADIAQAVDGWMDTLYHRLPLIHPGLERVGIDYQTATIGGREQGWACILYRQGTVNGTPAPHPILWPPGDIVGTARQFGGNESPCPTVADPLGGGSCPASAAIPTLGLHGMGDIRDASGTYRNVETGAEIPLFATYWDGGPTPHEQMGYMDDHIAFVPAPGTSLETALYEVTMNATVGGAPTTYRWRFRTGRSLPDVGCDDLGMINTMETAHGIETGSIDGRICEFADMYRVTGSSTRTVRIEFEHGEGDLDLVALDASGAEVGMSNGQGNTEELTVAAGNFFQVFGFGGAMGAYILTVE
ncbi:MAG: hypothetical protein DRJ42_25580 [Deltaproteobacteria bacterium]|nr:MAG: hypothetical protein DRJ42_25580 [Deltaproteobacteria bacterium]